MHERYGFMTSVAGSVTAVWMAAASLGAAPAPEKAFTGVCDIREYGAVGDGQTLNTKAIQAAIDACAAANGGTVLVPAGDFLTGTIQLKSNITLRLSPKGQLLGSTKRQDYLNRPEMEKLGVPPGNGNVVLIFAAREKNVTIEGNGTINGQGAAFYTGRGDGSAPPGSTSGGVAEGQATPASQPNTDRPHLIVFRDCENLKMRDVFLTASAYHCVRILNCAHVNFDGVRIYNRINLNNDGFHFNSCRYVRISNCEILCQDDACALFGSNQFVTITNSTFSTRWSVFRFGGGEAQNIAVSNCIIYDTYGCPIKMSSGGSSRIENLSFSNIIMRNVTGPIGIAFGAGRRRSEGTAPASPGYARNISFNNIRATVVPKPVKHEDLPFDVKVYDGEQNSCLTLNAYGTAFLENVSLSDIHVTYAGGGTAEQAAKRKIPERAREYFGVWGEAPVGPPAYGMYARNVRGLRMQNVRFDYQEPDARPAVVFDNVQDAAVANLSVQGSTGPEPALRFVNSKDVYVGAPRLLSPAAVFLLLEGAGNQNITVEGGDIDRAAKPLSFAEGATAAMVKLRQWAQPSGVVTAPRQSGAKPGPARRRPSSPKQ